MKPRALSLALALFAGPALGCDYPAGPPGAEPVSATGDGVVWAYLSNATDAYPHGVFGSPLEASVLRATIAGAAVGGGTDAPSLCEPSVVLGENAVFEDRTPRIADVTGDGLNDVIVVESRLDAGAALAVYGLAGARFEKLAQTPHIGISNRWLAPVGVADFDADGIADVAYVETPHIGGTLRVWSFAGREPREIGSFAGVSNHRFGELAIHGGVRLCPDGTEIVVADMGWRHTLGLSVRDGRVEARVLVEDAAPATIAAALECP